MRIFHQTVSHKYYTQLTCDDFTLAYFLGEIQNRFSLNVFSNDYLYTICLSWNEPFNAWCVFWDIPTYLRSLATRHLYMQIKPHVKILLLANFSERTWRRQHFLLPQLKQFRFWTNQRLLEHVILLEVVVPLPFPPANSWRQRFSRTVRRVACEIIWLPMLEIWPVKLLPRL